MMLVGRRIVWGLSVAVLVTSAGISGCGMPGSPLPPSLNLPEQVKNLTASRQTNHVVLHWDTPRRNTDRLLLKGEYIARVCRRESEKDVCMFAGEVQVKPGEQGSFEEELPPALSMGAPRPLRYAVEIQNHARHSAGLSNEALVVAGHAPAALTGLTADVHPEGVLLRWQPLAGTTSAVRVHRKLLTPSKKSPQTNKKTEPTRQEEVRGTAQEPEQQSLFVSGEDAGKKNGVLDTSAVFDRKYAYTAERVLQVKFGAALAELPGQASNTVEVDTKDIFPPAVPGDLAAIAVPEEGAIDLSWTPDTDEDLAGYRVYRREGTGDWIQVSPRSLLVAPSFRDETAKAGMTYEYAVSAVDADGNESQRTDGQTVTMPR